jgi:ABC-type nitrate/sulfonate/bicarbonate transport system permease component
MAQARLSRAGSLAPPGLPAWRLQLVTLIAVWALWEAIAASELFYRGVVPSLSLIAAAFMQLVASPQFWFNLSVTGTEIASAIVLGGGAGVLVGLALGGNHFLSAAFEPYVSALAATPKIVILPIVYLMFGVGPQSKIAISAFACFIPVALSVATGVREMRSVLVQVGRSLNLSHGQMIGKIYLPALIEPLKTGLRVGLSAAIAVCLIAEIKFSRIGLGAMVIDSFNHSRFAEVYAVLIVIISLAMSGNALLNRVSRGRQRAR